MRTPESWAEEIVTWTALVVRGTAAEVDKRKQELESIVKRIQDEAVEEGFDHGQANILEAQGG